MTREPERDATFLEALEACRARVRAGEPLEAALAGHPVAWHGELTALLVAGERVAGAAGDAAPAFVAGFEPALLAAVDEARARRRARARGPWPRRPGAPAMRAAAIALVAALVLAGGGVAVVEASADALPGDQLYRVTEWRESVELWLARSDSARLTTYQQQLGRRTGALERAVAQGVAAPRLARMEREFARDVRRLVDRAVRLHDAGDERAANRALQALDRLRGRVQQLAATATAPTQRALLLRLDRLLAAQQDRLRAPSGDGTGGAPARTHRRGAATGAGIAAPGLRSAGPHGGTQPR